MKLTIELVPSTSWGNNLRQVLTATEWDAVKKASARKAGYQCEICSGRGPKHPVECHEIWQYDDLRHIQTLVGVQSLCPACHRVKHIGNAMNMGLLEPTIRHMAKINQMDYAITRDFVNRAFRVWMERSKSTWTVVVEPVLSTLKK